MPENLPPDILTSVDKALQFIDSVLVPLGGVVNAENIESVVEASRATGFFYKTQPEEFGGNPASTLELTALRGTGCIE